MHISIESVVFRYLGDFVIQAFHENRGQRVSQVNSRETIYGIYTARCHGSAAESARLLARAPHTKFCMSRRTLQCVRSDD